MPVNTTTSIKYGFFHSNSKILTELNQELYEAPYKSSHITRINEILVDNIDFAPTPTDADDFTQNNPQILKKYIKQPLTPIPGSNYQAWYLHDNDNNKWVKPFITADLVTNELNQTSNGYRFLLYDQNLYPIGPTSGSWLINPFQGIVYFEKDFTPNDLGLGIPRVTCYAYVGNTLDVLIDRITPDTYEYSSDYPSVVHTLQHNLNSFHLQISLLVQDPITLEWNNDLVKLNYSDENTIKIYLTDMCNVKATVSKIK